MFARKDDFGNKQLLSEHLKNVASLCRDNSKFCGCEDIAELLGLIHDVGKYFPDWQEYLELGDRKNMVVHSEHASSFVQKIFEDDARTEQLGLIPSRHHSFLHRLDETEKGGVPPVPQDFLIRVQKLTEQLSDAWSDNLLEEISSFESWDKLGTLPWILFLQTMYSVLVDADRIDAANFDGRPVPEFDEFQVLSEKFSAHLSGIKTKQTNMDHIREEVASACDKASDSDNNFFSLTAPTGSGKTFASLRFALNRCLNKGKKRIIYVLPYQSIIKQTYGDLREIFGEKNVLEYHSSVDSYQKGVPWEEPIIVTTYQQFFESFFSFSASRSRKLRYMAESVIILDETQMFPQKFHCILETLVEFLNKFYRSDVLAMSATLPDWTLALRPHRILDAPESLYEASKRVRINIFREEDDKLAEAFMSYRSVLYVVNSRERAVRFHRALGDDSVYLLTSLMHSADRERIIDEIKEKLRLKKVCRIVATTLIDVGVDISVDSVFRDISDFGAMLQSFGRCNRHAETEKRAVFIVVRKYSCGPEINARIARTERFIGSRLKKNEPFDTLEAVQAYYKSLTPISEKNSTKSESISKLNHLTRSFMFSEISSWLQIIDDVRDDIHLIIVKDREELDKIRSKISEKSSFFKEIQKITIHVPQKFIKKGLTLIPFSGIKKEDEETFFLVGAGYGIYGLEPEF